MDPLYTSKLEEIEKTLDRWLPARPGERWADSVFGNRLDPQLLQALAAPGRDLLSRGGKRWRPLLMTLVCESLGGGGAALPLSPLVEFCHNASLIHDDIEDNSDERRGKPAVHIIHGVDAAINSGSFLYFLPLACIDSWAKGLVAQAGLSPEAALAGKSKVYGLWALSMRKLHLGQAIDIHWHRSFDLVPPLEEYFTMCKLKTGCLARFAAEIGALSAEIASAAQQHDCTRLIEAAEKLGVGFQILDDVKNLTTGLPGKKRGDDIVEGKKSLPLLLFLRRPGKKEIVRRCFSAAASTGVNAPEVEELINALLAEGVLAEAEEQGKAFISGAQAEFASLKPGSTAAGALAGLINQIT
jgi:octaprenyl-diphosphate synthase